MLIIAVLLYGLCGYLAQLPCLQTYSKAIRLGIIVSSCGIIYPVLLLLFRRLIIRGAIKAFLIAIKNKLPGKIYKLTGLPL